MNTTSYTINEYGEIARKDYFFQAAKAGSQNPLPSSRNVLVIWLLSILTLGIYGLILMFNMARETNITCESDGKHTRNFWGAIGLSIITLGIYAFIWAFKWYNREAAYLRGHNRGAKLTGGAYVFFTFIEVILMYVASYQQLIGAEETATICQIVAIVIDFIMLALTTAQHNLVNKIHNLGKFPHK